MSQNHQKSDEEEQQQEIIRKPNIKEKPNLQFAQKDIKTGIEQVAISEKDVATDRRLQRLQRAQQATATTTTDGLRRRRVVELKKNQTLKKKNWLMKTNLLDKE
ncbi:unnamed protein product [Cunninghamella blakesleeana]